MGFSPESVSPCHCSLPCWHSTIRLWLRQLSEALSLVRFLRELPAQCCYAWADLCAMLTSSQKSHVSHARHASHAVGSHRARVAVLCGVLFLSGTGALIFETLWLRLSGLVFGNSIWAAALILSSFMAGLALGNALAASSRIRGGWGA